MSRDDDKFMLRLKPGQREFLKQRAKLNGRSLNSEILHILSTTSLCPLCKGTGHIQENTWADIDEMPDPATMACR